jgi:hypothetical protein
METVIPRTALGPRVDLREVTEGTGGTIVSIVVEGKGFDRMEGLDESAPCTNREEIVGKYEPGD